MQELSKSVSEQILNALSVLLHRTQEEIGALLLKEGSRLAPIQGRCLSFIKRNPGCTEADIIRESGRDKGQIARLVATLTEQGYLSRMPDTPKARRRRIVLTPAGRKAQHLAESVRTQVAQQLIHELKSEEAVRLLELLTRLSPDVPRQKEATENESN